MSQLWPAEWALILRFDRSRKSNSEKSRNNMHATQLAEIANWAAFNISRLISGTNSLTPASCNEYWSQSKCRQHRWVTALKMFENDIRQADARHDPWPAIEIVIQEILVAELLTRVWSAAMAAHDARHRRNELGSVAHSIHIGHVETRNRALRLLLENETVSPTTFDRLNSLRRSVERWTDLLLAQSPDFVSANEFAFDSKRVSDFREDNAEYDDTVMRTRRLLFSASMSEDFGQLTLRYSANPGINRRIAGGVMSCFPADRFDTSGIPKSIQMYWLEQATDETQQLMDLLATLDRQAPAHNVAD